MGVAAGAGLGGHDGAGEEAGQKSGYSQVVSGLWEHCPLELRSKVGKRCVSHPPHIKKRVLKLSFVGRSPLSTLFCHCPAGEPQARQLQGPCTQGLMNTLISYLICPGLTGSCALGLTLCIGAGTGCFPDLIVLLTASGQPGRTAHKTHCHDNEGSDLYGSGGAGSWGWGASDLADQS